MNFILCRTPLLALAILLSAQSLPEITSITPSAGQTGQTLTVTVTGQFTHFSSGDSTISFGAGIAVLSSGDPDDSDDSRQGNFGPLTVTSPTTGTCRIRINTTASPGVRDVTVRTDQEQAVLAGGFSVLPAPQPTLLSVSPATGQAGSTLSVTLAGQFTNFVSGKTHADFGPEITVGSGPEADPGSVTVTSPTTATARLVIESDAATGPRTISVQTGNEKVTLANGFSVTPGPKLVSMTPNSARAGDSVTAIITAANTSFVQGQIKASLGNGIALSGAAAGQFGVVTVTGPTTATATFSIRLDADLGDRTLMIDLGGQKISLAGAFKVLPGPPIITITSPRDLTFTNINTVTVRGTVSDPKATVTVNGIAAANAQGSFFATVPLSEGNNVITAVAQAAGGLANSASIEVTLDTVPPRITIHSPAPGTITTASAVTVSGTVNDIVVGTVNDQQVTVTVNGAAAQVANRSFLLANVALKLGANTIRVDGRDRSGNGTTTTVTVNRVAATKPHLQMISGDAQTAAVSTAVTAPLVVSMVDGMGAPLANRPVVFKVVQDNGSLDGGAATVSKYQANGETLAVVVNTNAQGQASVRWTLGARSGAGMNRVEATAVGLPGAVVFTATGTASQAKQINVDAGSGQTGAVGTALPFPLVVVVTDAGHNRLSGVPVTFSVTQGGGSVNGQTSIAQTTDSDGRALAVLTLGPQAGIENNRVSATFPGNPGVPASFSATALQPGDPAATRITGVVLTNSNQPLPGVTMRMFLPFQGQANNVPVPVGTPVKTDAQGQFVIQPAPVGKLKLMADGGTASRPGTWPTLEFDMITIPGQNNTLGMPIYLLPLDPVTKLCVDETKGGTLFLPQAPGFSLTVAAGSATFPGGSRSGCVSVTPVHTDKVPMVPGFGQQPRFIVTIQPVGTIFNPPAPMTIPNVDGLKPNEVTEMYSFDHDLSSFVAIGTGTVTSDGQMVKSDAGVGVMKAGWHSLGPPVVPSDAENVRVTVDASPFLGIEQGKTGTMTATGDPQPGQYSWQVNSSLVTLQGSSAAPSITLLGNDVGSTQATVVYTDTATGASATAAGQVVVARLDLADPVLTAGEAVVNTEDSNDNGDDPDYTNVPPIPTSSAPTGGPVSMIKRNAPLAAKPTGPFLTPPDGITRDTTPAPCPAGSGGTPGSKTFLGDTSYPGSTKKAGDSLKFTACLAGLPQNSNATTWTIEKQNSVTDDANPLTGTGKQFTTRGKSARPTRNGNNWIRTKAKSTAMEYQVTAKAIVGKTDITKTLSLKQDESIPYAKSTSTTIRPSPHGTRSSQLSHPIAHTTLVRTRQFLRSYLLPSAPSKTR